MTTTHLVRPFLDLDNMLPQLLTILDPCLLLEETLSLRIQYQETAVSRKGPKRRLDITTFIHGRRLEKVVELGSTGNQRTKLRRNELYRCHCVRFSDEVGLESRRVFGLLLVHPSNVIESDTSTQRFKLVNPPHWLCHHRPTHVGRRPYRHEPCRVSSRHSRTGRRRQIHPARSANAASVPQGKRGMTPSSPCQPSKPASQKQHRNGHSGNRKSLRGRRRYESRLVTVLRSAKKKNPLIIPAVLG